jgi:HSP20 family protein
MSPDRRRIFFEPALSMVSECVWRPAVDVRRTANGWVIKAELAGVPADQVQVTMRGNSVLISGVRRDALEGEGARCYTMEIAYSKFERRIELPAPVEGGELSISSRDGLLILKIHVRQASERP